VAIDRDRRSQGEVGQLADDKDDDDDDEDPSVLALLRASAAGSAALSEFVGRSHGGDQSLVEEGQRRERDEESNDEVQ